MLLWPTELGLKPYGAYLLYPPYILGIGGTPTGVIPCGP